MLDWSASSGLGYRDLRYRYQVLLSYLMCLEYQLFVVGRIGGFFGTPPVIVRSFTLVPADF